MGLKEAFNKTWVLITLPIIITTIFSFIVPLIQQHYITPLLLGFIFILFVIVLSIIVSAHFKELEEIKNSLRTIVFMQQKLEESIKRTKKSRMM